MSTITTRAGKGTPLTHNEVDANFTNLNSDKYEAGDSPSFGSITVTGTVDGRDVAADGSKLDGIEVGADVTDTANVTAAGALMDSELTSEAAVKALDQGVATTDSPEFAGITLPSINGGPLAGFRNAIINGNFGVNQRGVSGTVTLSAGEYGHDRWKAGASGCTYTFATSANVTTLTITAGSLVQVIEGQNLFSGTYTLSFTGTAQGKIGAGSFGASGITGSVTGGTNLSIEFNTGTVSQVQLEAGSVATPFERRPVGTELALCQRYYEKGFLEFGGYLQTGIGPLERITFANSKRITPSVSLSNLAAVGNVSTSNFNTGSLTTDGLTFQAGSGTGTGGFIAGANFVADAEL